MLKITLSSAVFEKIISPAFVVLLRKINVATIIYLFVRVFDLWCRVWFRYIYRVVILYAVDASKLNYHRQLTQVVSFVGNTIVCRCSQSLDAIVWNRETMFLFVKKFHFSVIFSLCCKCLRGFQLIFVPRDELEFQNSLIYPHTHYLGKNARFFQR